MATGRLRDEDDVAAALTRWMSTRAPDRAGLRVVELTRPSAGWSNETFLFTVAWDGAEGAVTERAVLRLPTLVPTYPDYDLAAQAQVHDTLHAAGVPVPHPVVYEPDAHWLGSPFLVMPRVGGRPAGEAPALDPWLTSLERATQTAVHENYLDALAAVHRLDPASLVGVLRGGDGQLRDEVAWWGEYAEWAADGSPARGLLDALAWCREHVPVDEPRASLCWGDPRPGNVMFDDTGAVVAVLDWELASLGPAELDVGWHFALDDLVERVVQQRVPGFLERDAALAHYERRLGRPVVDLAWHEVFALTRSAAINDRQARMAAAVGADYPGVAGDDNPVLRYIARRIERGRDPYRSSKTRMEPE